MAANQFADLTADEFAGKFCGCAKPVDMEVKYEIVENDIPEAIDWREKGAVSPVKDQGACGSCWTFSTTGTLESTNYIKTGVMTLLSEQQIVDCAKGSKYPNYGCSGGWPHSALDYAKDVGLCTDDYYPYTSKDGGCHDSTCEKVVKVKSYKTLPQGDEKALAAAVAITPVSIVLDASAMQLYSSGIIDKCTDNINHAVLAAGYGEENGVKYWIVKNSWGTSWGENGYCRIQKDTGGMGMCAITYSSVFADELEDL